MEPPLHDRLCSWLGLPPGSWPPEHYALLGLPRGSGDVGDIESRVLEQMEMLRAHQLLHPELVTEGMNRLAQAMVCLTDPVARATYDRSLGIAPPPFEVVEDEPQTEDEPRPGDTRQIELPFKPRAPAFEVVEDEPEPLPERLPYEVVDEELPPRPAFEVVEDEAAARGENRELVAIPVAPTEPEVPAPFAAYTPLSRRTIYRRLAALRKAIRAWEDLRPVFGTPDETLATPVAVLMFVQALMGAREALAGVEWLIRDPGDPGGAVAALVRLPHVLHAARTLLPSQRQAVALDWRRGLDALRREQVRLREMAFVARPRRPGSGRRLLLAVRRSPEWVLLFAGLIALVLAAIRRNS